MLVYWCLLPPPAQAVLKHFKIRYVTILLLFQDRILHGSPAQPQTCGIPPQSSERWITDMSYQLGFHPEFLLLKSWSLL